MSWLDPNVINLILTSLLILFGAAHAKQKGGVALVLDNLVKQTPTVTELKEQLERIETNQKLIIELMHKNNLIKNALDKKESLVLVKKQG